jgi:Asp-tRNA(Asn)/Glu-tRNA(Gln) amidotransferase A subunit family amidase
MTEDLCFLPAFRLVEEYRARRLSPVEVTRAVLERIDALNPALNAFVTLCPEDALRDAAASEEAYRRGAPRGPLDGVPVSIKDLVPTKGLRTTFGSLLFRDHVPDHDAPMVERLRQGGAVILGKTNTPEFGAAPYTDNLLFGRTNNPWNLERTSGGSSGGAGAAVAAGLGPIAQGSDGGGSIRIPSAFCGIFGLKPTYGRIPRESAAASWTTLSHLGPMTRTVRDAALFLDATAGHHPADPFSLPGPTRSFTDEVDLGIAGLRAAWSPDLGWGVVDRRVEQVCRAAAFRLRDAGAEVVEYTPDLLDPYETRTFMNIAAPEDTAYLSQFGEEALGLLTEEARAFHEYGKRVSAVEYVEANRRRWTLRDQLDAFFRQYDLLLTPAVAIVAFPHGAEIREVAGKPVRPFGWSPFTVPFNLTGLPAASVPCGFVDGMPVGLQVVAPAFRDDLALRASRALEHLLPWSDTIPPVAAG